MSTTKSAEPLLNPHEQISSLTVLAVTRCKLEERGGDFRVLEV